MRFNTEVLLKKYSANEEKTWLEDRSGIKCCQQAEASALHSTFCAPFNDVILTGEC